jgi:hypothetical protein
MTMDVKKSEKKRYQQPVLLVYGAIETLTLSTNKTGANSDGGPGNSPNKTV